MNDSAKKAIEALKKLLEDPSPGMRLEAARELLKYDAAIR